MMWYTDRNWVSCGIKINRIHLESKLTRLFFPLRWSKLQPPFTSAQAKCFIMLFSPSHSYFLCRPQYDTIWVNKCSANVSSWHEYIPELSVMFVCVNMNPWPSALAPPRGALVPLSCSPKTPMNAHAALLTIADNKVFWWHSYPGSAVYIQTWNSELCPIGATNTSSPSAHKTEEMVFDHSP